MEHVQSAANAYRRLETPAQARAQTVLASYAGIARVADLYDHDARFADSLRGLAGPDFEYPDFSGLTVALAIKKAEKLGQLQVEVGPDGSAFRHGYCAAMTGFSVEYPGNIRSKTEKTGWTDGYCAGKRAREAMLNGMAHVQFNGRTLVPTIAGYSPETFRAVWRDERAGKDYTEVPTSGAQPTAQRYRVYHLTDTRPESVRELSHNHALLDIQRDSTQAATVFVTPAQTCEYKLVAEVEAVGLDDVFKLTNTIEQYWWLNSEVQAKFPAAGCRSTSAGDIVLDAAGVAHFCDRFGWVELGQLDPLKPATSV